jgi:NAD(P)-dependent dehydrogenase (short-subunit alcohol dehydrogenase family)
MPHSLVLGASQGIGFGFVQRFLSEGHCVHATYRDRLSAAPLFDLAAQTPKLKLYALDITEELQIVSVLETIAQDMKQSVESAEASTELCYVINCIGILHQGDLQPEKSLRQINSENLLTYFQVNSIASILLAKHLAPLIKSSPRTVFATLSAKVGSITDNQLGGWYGYRASKTALNMFMKTIALEYRRTCKTTIVAVLHPGTTDTQLSQPFQRNVPPEKLFSIDRAVDQLYAVMKDLTIADSGEFFSWDGTRLPW